MVISNVCYSCGAVSQGSNNLKRFTRHLDNLTHWRVIPYCVTDFPDAERSPRERVTRNCTPSHHKIGKISGKGVI